MARSIIDTARGLAKQVVYRVRRDEVSGLRCYPYLGTMVFVRSADECERPESMKFALDEIYFKHHSPTGDECVVDFGAGTGTEIVGLAARAPSLHYIAVEIQPSLYECLALTLDQLPSGFVPYQLAVGLGPTTKITPTRAGINATTLGEGSVPIETIPWGEFKNRHGIDKVDLLKMNIEGGETALLEHINLDDIMRVIVSVHDFRADRGHGEHYRTRASVEAILTRASFRLTHFSGAEDWKRSWVYAERVDSCSG